MELCITARHGAGIARPLLLAVNILSGGGLRETRRIKENIQFTFSCIDLTWKNIFAFVDFYCIPIFICVYIYICTYFSSYLYVLFWFTIHAANWICWTVFSWFSWSGSSWTVAAGVRHAPIAGCLAIPKKRGTSKNGMTFWSFISWLHRNEVPS